MMIKKKTKISIIMPCYNEEDYLPSLFEAIDRLKTEKTSYEVIIVDNGSSDRSVQIAREHDTTVLIEPGVNISALRNLGAKHASGQIFSFLDADCLPRPEWLNEASKYIEKADVGLFGSIPLCPSNGTWVEKAWTGISPKGANNAGFVCTANMFIKKNVFNQVNGFDESLVTGEDYDICQRILKAGYRIVHDDRVAVVHLRYPKTLFDRYKKEVWYGKEWLNILRIKPFYKPFWASLIFGFSFIIIISCLFLRSFGLFFEVTLILFFSIPVLSAVFKVSQSKSYRYLFHLILLYFVYLAGRFSSIIIYWNFYSLPQKIIMRLTNKNV